MVQFSKLRVFDRNFENVFLFQVTDHKSDCHFLQFYHVHVIYFKKVSLQKLNKLIFLALIVGAILCANFQIWHQNDTQIRKF